MSRIIDGDKNSGYILQTLSRGASVLNLLLEKDSFSLTEASRALGLNPTITFRLLRTWVNSGYLYLDEETKLYGAGLTLMRLSAKARHSSGLPEVEERLERVTRQVDQTCCCGVLAGRNLLYVARALSTKVLKYSVEVGRTVPAYASSPGQVLLAYRPEQEVLGLYPEDELPAFTEHTPRTRGELVRLLAGIREQGYAVNERQYNSSVVGVAVPVRNSAGEVVAAFSIAGPAEYLRPEEIHRLYLPALLDAARDPVDIKL